MTRQVQARQTRQGRVDAGKTIEMADGVLRNRIRWRMIRTIRGSAVMPIVVRRSPAHDARGACSSPRSATEGSWAPPVITRISA